MTLHTASFPRSHACGPLASSPPNSTIIPCFDHSHQIPMEPVDGPVPPPFLLGSPSQLTKSLPVVSLAIVMADEAPSVLGALAELELVSNEKFRGEYGCVEKLQRIVLELLALKAVCRPVCTARRELQADAKFKIVEVDDVRVGFDLWTERVGRRD